MIQPHHIQITQQVLGTGGNVMSILRLKQSFPETEDNVEFEAVQFNGKNFNEVKTLINKYASEIIIEFAEISTYRVIPQIYGGDLSDVSIESADSVFPITEPSIILTSVVDGYPNTQIIRLGDWAIDSNKIFTNELITAVDPITVFINFDIISK